MRFGELFAGFGGIGLGLERAGMECAWQVENDPYCQRVLAKHWPNVKRISDVREAGKHNLEPVDLICGGFPCQPYSVAGKRRGQSDHRFLWPEMLRIISELMPATVLGENVSGIAHKSGAELERVCADLEAASFTVFPPIDIPACAFGLPTMERHVWIIAEANSVRSQGRVSPALPQQPQESWKLSRSYQGDGERWSVPEARVCRVAERIPYRVERNRGLGNAVPPAMAEWVGQLLLTSARNGDPEVTAERS